MQMKRTHPHGGDRVAAALETQGVPFVFTLCGGHISPILTAAKARGIRIIDCRDEATAVFAADAIARLTKIPGVAAVTAGPGLTNTITALKNAQLAQSPVVLIGGAAPTALQGRGALQDIDQRPLIAPHVKRFIKVQRVAGLAPAIEEAFAVAREGVPGPVCIECPVDLLYDETNIRQWYADAAGQGHVDRRPGTSLVSHAPRREDVRRRRSAGRRAREGSGAARAAGFAHRGHGCGAREGRAAADGDRQSGAVARRGGRIASRPQWRSLASPFILAGWRAGCSAASMRCRCGTRAATRCASQTA